MQRQTIDGVPYWIDKHNTVFVWDTEAQPLRIGTYDPTSKHVSYDDGHFEKLADRLSLWRSNQRARPRKSVARGNRGNQAPSSESSDGEE